MNRENIVFWLTWVGLACWGLCFWWMRRISARQDALLAQLKAQGRRIEALSKAEHDLIKEVHPQVGEIKEGMQEVVDSVRENAGAVSLARSQAGLDEGK
jgi:cell division protein FtsB